MSRSDDIERLCSMAGITPDGGILPHPPGGDIDRTPKSWWRTDRALSTAHLDIPPSPLRDALVAWHDARQAIFDHAADLVETPKRFARLAEAETALMALARLIRDPNHPVNPQGDHHD